MGKSRCEESRYVEAMLDPQSAKYCSAPIHRRCIVGPNNFNDWADGFACLNPNWNETYALDEISGNDWGDLPCTHLAGNACSKLEPVYGHALSVCGANAALFTSKTMNYNWESLGFGGCAKSEPTVSAGFKQGD